MSALGQKLTSSLGSRSQLSATQTDIGEATEQVRLVPKADMRFTEKRGSLPLGSGPPISGPELGTVLFVIESFRLGEIGLRVFHELGPSPLVAEAIGLPLVDRI